MKKVLSLAALAAIASAPLSAATINVPGDQATVAAAISAALDGDVINIAPGSYDEVLPDITIPNITIQGSDPFNRPTLLLQDNSTGDGINYFGAGASMSFTLTDVIIIQSSAGTPVGDDAINIRPGTASAPCLVTIENVLISSNNGSNQPLSTDFYDDSDPLGAGVIAFPDDPIYIMSRPSFGGNSSIISTVFTDVQILNATSGLGGDVVLYPDDLDAGTPTHTWNNVEVTRIDDIQVSDGQTSTFNITGLKIRASNTAWQGFQADSLNFTDSWFIDNTAFGIQADSDTTANVSVDNCLFVNNVGEAFFTNFGAAGPQTWTITGSTFYNNGTTVAGGAAIKMESSVTADSTITVTDCVIAGSGQSAAENLGAGAIDFVNCAIVTSGPDALAGLAPGTSTGTITETSSINDDPVFAVTPADPNDVPVDADYLDVTATSYDTAASGGGVLTGFTTTIPADVNTWTEYTY